VHQGAIHDWIAMSYQCAGLGTGPKPGYYIQPQPQPQQHKFI
jgi:hypothetical protein